MIKENNPENVKKFQNLLKLVKSKHNIVRQFYMNEYAEFLEEKDCKKIVLTAREMQKSKRQKEMSEHNNNSNNTLPVPVRYNRGELVQDIVKLSSIFKLLSCINLLFLNLTSTISKRIIVKMQVKITVK